MNNIKIIYFDSINLESAIIENMLRAQCQSIYVIKDGLLLANYKGSSKDLFYLLFPNDVKENVLIADLDTTSYWGFMNKDLWAWFSDNKEN